MSWATITRLQQFRPRLRSIGGASATPALQFSKPKLLLFVLATALAALLTAAAATLLYDLPQARVGIIGGVVAASLISAVLMGIWFQRERELARSSFALAGETRERESAQHALARAQDDLRGLNAELEHRVARRTEELVAANKELESFSYSVSHDLRAPVRAIAGFSKLLAEQHGEELDSEALRKLGIVRSEAARMGALIDDLLAFSRLGRQSLQMKTVDMTELVRTNLETLGAGNSGGHPKVTIGALPAANGDRALLAQVWANLLANAFKFSARKDAPAIEVDAYVNETDNVYLVRDNGIGFDPRYVSKLFGVFQRLHDPAEFPGTGVGLALVERIIARHGGRVWAEGQPDAGATFYFSLPRT